MMYLKALSSNVFVQSFGGGFHESYMDGFMAVKVSHPAQGCVFIQLYPGGSIKVDGLTLSIVRKHHQDNPILTSPATTSRFNTYLEQVNQVKTLHDRPEPLDTRTMSTTPDRPNFSRLFDRQRVITDTMDKRLGAQEQLVPSPEHIDTELSSPSPQEPIESKLQDSPKPVRPRAIDANVSGGENTSMVDLDHTTEVTTEADSEVPIDDGEPESRDYQSDTQGSILGTIRVNASTRVTEPNDDTENFSSVIRPDQDLAADTATPRSIPSSKKRKRALENTALPTNSMGSRRSSTREDSIASPGYMENVIKLVFATSSTVGSSTQFVKFLKDQKVKIVTSIDECTVLCVGKGELKKTCKLIMATLLGKDIITDNWVTDSVKGKELLDMSSYRANDPAKEAEWGISLVDAIERGRRRTKCLEGWTIIYTPAAKKEVGKTGFDELKELALMAGAKTVNGALPKKPPSETPETLIIAIMDDPSVPKLEAGWKCFTRDIIGISILRGVLDTENDEFLVPKSEVDKERGRSSKRQKR